MITDGLNEFKGKRILMLQGPVGPFFSRFATDLRLAGAVVFKVNFNGGDWIFSRSAAFSRVFNFVAKPTEWSDYLSDLLARLKIDTVFLFGDCRPLHNIALSVIREQKIDVGVFEEGYLRPDHITLERGGVNSNSTLPNSPEFYLSQPKYAEEPHAPLALGSTYGQAAKSGMIYFAAASLWQLKFRHYQHHRRLGIGDGPFWLRSFWRKWHYRISERQVLPRLVAQESDRFFLVSLQTNGDSQMSVHSDFESVDQFIEYVVDSFANSAPKNCLLVLKHHPLDRGYSDYTALIKRLTAQHQLLGRCYYVHDQHLPTLLRHTAGVVVVNSTAGLSAVGEGVPVRVCGEAIYDIQGLTFQGSLDDFWTHAHSSVPDMALYKSFRAYLISHSQHRGSFYKKLPEAPYTSGILWADHGFSAPHQSGLSLPHTTKPRPFRWANSRQVGS